VREKKDILDGLSPLSSVVPRARREIKPRKKMTAYTESIAGWDKTKLALFRTRQLVSKLPEVTVPFIGQQLCLARSAKGLGVILPGGGGELPHLG